MTKWFVLPLLLFVVPYVFGEMVCRKRQNKMSLFHPYRFILGLFTMLTVWFFMSMSFMMLFPFSSFHRLRYSYIGILILLCVWATVNKSIHIDNLAGRVKATYYSFRDEMKKKASRWCITALIVLIGVQIGETVYYPPVGYINDDLTYCAYVNDAVYMDQLYAKNYSGYPSDSEEPNGIYDVVEFKQIVAPWFSFLAFLSASAGVHSLIICRTIMPAYILLVLYMVIYVFARYCFNDKKRWVIIFMLSASILVEILSYSYYQIFLMRFITIWGKSASAMIAIPMLLITLVSALSGNKEKKDYDSTNLILISSSTAAMLSFSSIISGTVGILLISAIHWYKSRRLNVLVYLMAGEIPFIIQIALSMYIKMLMVQ